MYAALVAKDAHGGVEAGTVVALTVEWSVVSLVVGTGTQEAADSFDPDDVSRSRCTSRPRPVRCPAASTSTTARWSAPRLTALSLAQVGRCTVIHRSSGNNGT